ncbi:MBL fold metallo-hydrolase [Alteromonas sp. RKMC-009]|uniref:MBL fold metallo-hydrolase n=1 Tax=Alteromonas sp. RKMC-009 TaxID=2267264 RepID=UPI000E6A28B6|nr:MBL fold metallo-hydrolase [Alteromonas sp. RKMC-009]AYA65570.1 MBL fold metallo-hydrolase [Alteromonas sp. RKMC-009]
MKTLKKRKWCRLLPALTIFCSLPVMATQDWWQTEAERAAGDDLVPLYHKYCKTGERQFQPELPANAFYVFDNLIFLGYERWNSWALLNNEQIIIFDAMETEKEARKYIIDGLVSLGLEPSKISHVVIMHGHGDHFGGAALLQRLFNAEVMASEADWQLMDVTRTLKERYPDQEHVIIDGVRIKVPVAGQTVPEKNRVISDGSSLYTIAGDILFYLTPGHTAGTLSAILPVTDSNKTYLAGFFGGTGFTAPGTPLDVFLSSLNRFKSLTADKEVVVPLSNHPTSDLTGLRAKQLSGRKKNGPHPFLLGQEGYQRFLSVFSSCLSSYINKE